MNYKCMFLINQNEEDRKFKDVEDSASSIFSDFICQGNYGEGIDSFRFDIYVTPTINFGLHNDYAYSGIAHLSANVDYNKFIQSNNDTKIRILLNAAYILLKYLDEKVVLPKNANIDNLKNDFEKFLKTKRLLMDVTELDSTVIKVFETTRFIFVRTKTGEIDDKEVHYDLNDIEYFINNELIGKTFGSSIRQFDFGYEFFDFSGSFADWFKKNAGYKRYSTKYKSLLIVKQFDSSKLLGLKPIEQFRILKNAILDSVKDIELMNKKPKDFDRQKFSNEIERILNAYEAKHFSI